jgi:hypothetical protein
MRGDETTEFQPLAGLGGYRYLVGMARGRHLKRYSLITINLRYTLHYRRRLNHCGDTLSLLLVIALSYREPLLLLQSLLFCYYVFVFQPIQFLLVTEPEDFFTVTYTHIVRFYNTLKQRQKSSVPSVIAITLHYILHYQTMLYNSGEKLLLVKVIAISTEELLARLKFITLSKFEPMVTT